MFKDKRKLIQNIGPFVGMLAVFLIGIWLRYFNRDFMSGDMEYCLLPWYDKIAEMDLKTSLNTQVGNYNTLYQLLIFLMTRIDIEPIYAYKLLSGVFDFILAAGGFAFLFRLGKKLNEHVELSERIKMACLAASLIWVSPIVWLNSASWGQCDSMYVACIIWAMVLLLDQKEIGAAILIGIAFAFKLQTIFILPFLFLYLCSQKKWYLKAIKCLVVTCLGFVCCILPNMIAGRPFSDSLDIYLGQTSEFEYMTMNYPGLGALVPDYYDMYKVPTIILALFFILLFCVYMFWKKRFVVADNMLIVAILTSMICVWFLPSMHERYGYMYEIFVILYCVQKKKGWGRLIVLSLVTYRAYLLFLDNIQYNIKICAVILFFILLSFVLEFVLYPSYQEKLDSMKALFIKEKSEDSNCISKLERFDYAFMIIAVISYFVLCLIGLGKNEAPTTGQTLSLQEGSNEVILEFNEPIAFKNINLFLGQEGLKTASVSSYEESEWKVIDSEAELNSAFCWNKIDLDYTTQYIGIVFRDDNTYVNEIVCKNANGEIVTPANSERYPELFDEQEIYPKRYDRNRAYLEMEPTYFEETMFDEVYHGRTAYEFLHGLSIYENTHPPLGKSIISIGIMLFGMNPFGWRIMCALFGSLMMPFFYMAAIRMTKKRCYGILAVGLATTEFMHYTLSRIATIDVIVALFILAMFYYMYAFLDSEKKRYLLLCGLSSGLAVATKWTGFYALAGIAIMFFVWLVRKCMKTGIKGEYLKQYLKLGAICVGCFILIPFTIYTLSYIPFVKVYTDQNLIQHVFSNGKNMLDYHKGVNQDHPYSSMWYSWFVDFKPLIDSRTYMPDDKVSVVATFGNPFVVLVGLAAVFYEIYLFFKKKNFLSGGLVISYLSMIVPWMFVTRTVFIYQYFMCILLLVVIITHAVSTMKHKWEAGTIGKLLIVNSVLFIMFYPVISGMAVSQSYIIEILKWLPSWMFV